MKYTIFTYFYKLPVAETMTEILCEIHKSDQKLY